MILGGQGRVLAPGVVAVEPKALRGAERRIQGTGGSWTNAGNGLAVVTLNGETIVAVSEGALRLVPIGQAAESASAGSGLAALRAQLRSELAKQGLDAWVDAHRAGRGDADVLADLERREDAEASKTRDPQSLHAVLEAAALTAARTHARTELVARIKATSFVNDAWVKQMIHDNNPGEIRGVLAEMRVHQMKTAEIAANPALAGRNVRVIDKVWVMARRPEANLLAWEAAHPRPARAAFPDEPSFEQARSEWAGKKASIKDLPGGGIGEQVKDVDHVVVEDTGGGKLNVLSTMETKYRPISGQQKEATEARDALVDAITHGTVRGTTAVVGRAEGNKVAEILTDKLEVSGTPPAEATTPDLVVDALAKDIIANPKAFEP
jgi:hypothetical protein